METIIEKDVVLRILKDSDIEDLLEFVKKVNGEEVAPVVKRLLKYYPNFPLSDNFIIYNTRSNKILAYLCLLRGHLVLNGTRVPFGQMEIVGTDPEHRHKGYIRKLNEAFEKRALEYDLPVLIIEGIPYFYRQFGYEFALNSFCYIGIPFESIPKIEDNEYDLIEIKRIDKSSFDRYLELRAKRNKLLDLYRDLDMSLALYFSHSTLQEVGMCGPYGVFLKSQIAGSFYLERFFGSLIVRELYLQDALTLPIILTYIAEIAKECDLPLHMDRPIQESVLNYVESITRSKFPTPYACYVRIPSTKIFLEHLAPVLERRLSSSELNEYSGKLVLSCYKGGCEIVVQKGKVQTVKELNRNELEGVHVALPPLVINQLFFGFRDINELEEIYPDVSVDPLYKHIVGVLFPKIKNDIAPTL